MEKNVEECGNSRVTRISLATVACRSASKIAYEAEGGRCCSGLQTAILRWQRSERRDAQPVSRQEECRARVLYFRLHRGLNRANEKLPEESCNSGSCRRPGPGCEYG